MRDQLIQRTQQYYSFMHLMTELEIKEGKAERISTIPAGKFNIPLSIKDARKSGHRRTE
jgi:hypothetical protein